MAIDLQSNLQYAQSIWSRRSLIRTFALNDLKKRYRNSALGFLWTILEPLLLLSVLMIVFTHLFKPNAIPHYPLYLLLNLILWQFFTRGTLLGVTCIIGKSRVVSKIYFPREILPISSTITSFMMLFFEFLIFITFLMVFKFVPPLTIGLLPLPVALEFILVLGVSLALSALNVYYRDVQYIWGVVSYAGLFLSPIFYTLSMFPADFQSLILLNPMAQIIEMSHNAALYGSLPTLSNLSYTIIFCCSTLAVGLAIFHKLEPRMADEI